VVTTLAGSGSPAFADGTGSEASFNLPRGVGVDLDGTIIVADSSNNRIRRITPGGVVTTIAGSGAVGNTDGIGTEATFSNPYSVIVRPDGTIVVADTGNSRIRLISPGGAVTTLAGSTAGYLDGTGTSARFNFPSSVGVLSNGVIVVGDNRNHRIRLVTPEGVVTTLAGGTAGYLDGIGTAARFTNPYGVAVLPNGVIAVTGNARVRLVTPAGVVSTLAGSTFGFADGTGSAAKFIGPRSIALLPSSSLIAVADSDNNRIRLVSPTGIVTTLAGSLGGADDGIGTAASFSRPDGVAVVPSSGAILVADTFNNRIRLISGAF
jgi:sugar lactone lactonase YvrE